MNSDIEVADIPAIQWLYSFAEQGWFSPQYNFAIPDDAIPVEAGVAESLKAGQAAGQVLIQAEDGTLLLADRPPPSDALLATIERRWRDQQLNATDPLVTRHRDEVELEQQTTLEADQYQALQLYRAALRQWPESEVFPEIIERPPAPPWLADLLT